jgi:tRNA nucleotidyltransferase/poly(A) polymerase
VFTDSLEEDSKRRDFTCNAVYFDVENEEFIDPT